MDYTLKEVNDEKLLKNFKGINKAYLVEPYNIILPDNTPSSLKKLENFEAREDDVYVVTFVKAGTALMQEIVYLLHNGIDAEKARNSNRELDFPYLEVGVWNVPPEFPDSYELLKALPSPRLIKTHLDYALMPPSSIEKKCKMIYVARNMKDVVVSYYFFSQTMNVMQFQGDINEFTDLFLKNLVPYCPYIDHVSRFWERRNDPNILFVTYEDMRKDLPSVVRKTASFLGKTLSDEEVNAVVDNCSFDKMKDNPAVNKQHYQGSVAKKEFSYLRKGIVGDCKNHFSSEDLERFSTLIEDNVKDSGLKTVIDYKG